MAAARGLLSHPSWILHIAHLEIAALVGQGSRLLLPKENKRGEFSLNGAFSFLVSFMTMGSSVAPGGRFSARFALTGSSRMDQDLQALFELEGYQHTNPPEQALHPHFLPPNDFKWSSLYNFSLLIISSERNCIIFRGLQV